MSQGLPEDTYPDGLCIDKDGGVWSARFVLLQCSPKISTLIIAARRHSWGGSRIIRYTKDGEMDLEVFFPTALNVTACTFGGKWALSRTMPDGH